MIKKMNQIDHQYQYPITRQNRCEGTNNKEQGPVAMSSPKALPITVPVITETEATENKNNVTSDRDNPDPIISNSHVASGNNIPINANDVASGHEHNVGGKKEHR